MSQSHEIASEEVAVTFPSKKLLPFFKMLRLELPRGRVIDAPRGLCLLLDALERHHFP